MISIDNNIDGDRGRNLSLDSEHAPSHPPSGLCLYQGIVGVQFSVGPISLHPRLRSGGLPSHNFSPGHKEGQIRYFIHSPALLPGVHEQGGQERGWSGGEWLRR